MTDIDELLSGKDLTSYVLVAVERPTPTTYGAMRVVGPFATRDELAAYRAPVSATNDIKIDVTAVTLLPPGTPVDQFLLGH